MSVRSLDRLLRPKSICVIGGDWASSVVHQCQLLGFGGDIWPVHPTRSELGGLPCFASLADLPGVPDACFVGINRHASIKAVAELAALGAGGAVCFASGFSEASAEDTAANDLEQKLLEAAGDMPVLGPNCYGFINYLDGALLWPDQHGGKRCNRGIALIAQSSNIALNLTMQLRGLPIAYVITVGNQSQQSLGDIASAVIQDERVSAVGLYIEGFGDIVAFEKMAVLAKEKMTPVVALKAGKSRKAQQALISHTNSLSGNDAAANAFLLRCGIARVHSINVLLETLKLLHICGPLQGNTIQSMSCSGGEAGLMADAFDNSPLVFPELTKNQEANLRLALGPLVALANPLDYNTYSWGHAEQLTAAFTAMLESTAAMTLLLIDLPKAHCDAKSWQITIDAFTHAKQQTGVNAAVLATMPENLPEALALDLIDCGIVPFVGIEDTVKALEAAYSIYQLRSAGDSEPCLNPVTRPGEKYLLDEKVAKAALAEAGLKVPDSVAVQQPLELETVLADFQFPVVLKGLGVAHKTEANAIHLGLETLEEVLFAAESMGDSVSGYLVEAYVEDKIAELLVSIVRDRTLGFLLTLAAGGVYSELNQDATHLLLPFTEEDVEKALDRLKTGSVIEGYRGAPAAHRQSIIESIMALQHYAMDNQSQLLEVEINPLICGEHNATAVDALIVLSGESQ